MRIAPDREAERPFLPDPATLTGCLLLADRGYPSVSYFEAVAAQGGACLVRLTRNYAPWVCTARVDGLAFRCRRGCGCRACWLGMPIGTWISTWNSTEGITVSGFESWRCRAATPR